MSCVCILALFAIWCNFYHLEPRVLGFGNNADRSKIVFIKCFLEKSLYFFRTRVRGYVPVLRFPIKQKIAYTPTHQIRLKTFRAERVGKRRDFFWYREFFFSHRPIVLNCLFLSDIPRIIQLFCPRRSTDRTRRFGRRNVGSTPAEGTKSTPPAAFFLGGGGGSPPA